jgi:5-(carboxyamino)imidazole ribonucleotide mutase
MLVPIIMGSESDKDHAQKIIEVLDKFGVQHVEHIASAHKVPEKVLEIVQKYNASDEAVCYITIAGRSNGLSGVVAANAVHPVIACPPFKSKEDCLLNMHSTLQMPSETPVLMILDPGNAALAAVRILGLADKNLKDKASEAIKKMKGKF